MIFKLVKKSFKEVNSNPPITLFFVLFLILIALFTPYIFVMPSKIYGFIIILCVFFLSTLFFGGWLQMFGEVLKEDKKSLPGVFFEGAGKNIIPAIIIVLIYIVLTVLISFIAVKASLKLFGDISFLMNDLATVAQDKTAYLEYINNLTPEKTTIIYGWQVTFILLYSVFNFLFMFLPAIFVKTECENVFLKPFIVLKDNFKFVFKNFGFAICLYALICLGFIAMSIIKTISALHPVLSLVYIFINIYFISYVVMLIFNCYEQKNSCCNGPDSIGENKDGDSTGEEE